MLKLAALVAGPLLLTGAVIGPTVAVVDVREGGGGVRIVLPVPLLLVRAGLHLAPDVKAEGLEENERLARIAPVIVALLDELRHVPDAELVSVEDGPERVSVTKAGGELEVRVEAPGESVRVTVPLALARELVGRLADRRLEGADLAAALRKLPRGELARVQDGEDRIRIWVF